MVEFFIIIAHKVAINILYEEGWSMKLQDTEDYIQLHFKKAQTAFWEKSPYFYFNAWMFVRETLLIKSKTFNTEEVDYVALINDHIDDCELRDNIHNIRKRRNEFVHKNNDYKAPGEQVLTKDIISLNKFIDFLNHNTANDMKIENKFKIMKIKKHDVGLREFFTAVKKGKDDSKQTIKYEKKAENIYEGGYNSIPIQFRVTTSVKNDKTYSSLFSVIHNLLTRSSKIRLSKFLKAKVSINVNLNRIFIYEILLLNAIKQGHFVDGIQVIEVDERDEKEFDLALNNVLYHFRMLSEMSGNQENLSFNIISKQETYDPAKIKLIVNKHTNGAEILELGYEDVENHFWIHSQIKYLLNNDNYIYYKEMLIELFGHSNFKEGQILAIKKLLKSDTEALMTILPTGYGKSLIYQFLAIIQPCISIVVSPSQELIHDQLINLEEQSIDQAGYFEISDESLGIFKITRDLSINNIIFSNLIYYMTPAQILVEDVLRVLKYFANIGVLNMLTIDECHHMSVWGHKFESEFFTVTKQLVDRINVPKILLCSATASQKVKEDIQLQFETKKLEIIQPVPLDRGHIDYKFITSENIDTISEDILSIFNNQYNTNSTFDVSNSGRIPTSTIIVNNEREILLNIYAKLSKDERINRYIVLYSGENETYHRFRSGQKTVLLCTEEYLYGINMPYLRNMIFIGLPPSKEWFYQQTGRVGRKGQDSKVLNYFFSEHSKMLKSFVDQNVKIENIIKSIKKDGIVSYDLSNVKFTIDNIRDNNEERTISNHLFHEIQNKVYVSSTYKDGHLRGRIPYKEKDYWEFVLYIFYVSGLIKKWVIESDDGRALKYIFGINMEFERGSLYFENKATDIINALSGDVRIRDSFAAKITKNKHGISGILIILLEWFLISSVSIKRQMLINMWQLSESAADGMFTSDDVERDLSMHFMGNSNNGLEFVETDVTQIEDIESGNEDFKWLSDNYTINYVKIKESIMSEYEFETKQTEEKVKEDNTSVKLQKEDLEHESKTFGTMNTEDIKFKEPKLDKNANTVEPLVAKKKESKKVVLKQKMDKKYNHDELDKNKSVLSKINDAFYSRFGDTIDSDDLISEDLIEKIIYYLLTQTSHLNLLVKY